MEVVIVAFCICLRVTQRVTHIYDEGFACHAYEGIACHAYDDDFACHTYEVGQLIFTTFIYNNF